MRIEECEGEEDKKEEIQWVQKSLEWWTYFIDYGDNFMGIQICQSLSNCTFKYEQYIVCQLIPPTNVFRDKWATECTKSYTEFK